MSMVRGSTVPTEGAGLLAEACMAVDKRMPEACRFADKMTPEACRFADK